MKVIPLFLFSLLLFSVGCNTPPDVQPNNNQISVYPNPTLYEINIRIMNPANLPCTVHVFGTNGDALFTDENNESESEYRVNIANKPKGAYQVIVQKGDVKTIQRIIKI